MDILLLFKDLLDSPVFQVLVELERQVFLVSVVIVHLDLVDLVLHLDFLASVDSQE